MRPYIAFDPFLGGSFGPVGVFDLKDNVFPKIEEIGSTPDG